MKKLKEIEVPLEAFFLGKWNLDRDLPQIPATQLHMPRLRSDNIKYTVGNHHNTYCVPSNFVIDRAKRTDIIFKIVTPDKSKKKQSRGCKRKVNETQNNKEQARERVDLPAMIVNQGSCLRAHNNDKEDVILSRPPKRRAAVQASLILKDIVTPQAKNKTRSKILSLENEALREEKLPQKDQEKINRCRGKENKVNINKQEKNEIKQHVSKKLTKGAQEKADKVSEKHNESEKDKITVCRTRSKRGRKPLIIVLDSGDSDDDDDRSKPRKEKKKTFKSQNIAERKDNKKSTPPKKNDKKKVPEKGIKESCNVNVQKWTENKIERGKATIAEDDKIVVQRTRSQRKRKPLVLDNNNSDEDSVIICMSDRNDDSPGNSDESWVLKSRSNNNVICRRKPRKKKRNSESTNKEEKIDSKKKTVPKEKNVQKQVTKVNSNVTSQKHTKNKTKKAKSTKALQNNKTADRQASKVNGKEITKENPKLEDIEVTAKRGTLKYLLQREEYLKAKAKEIEAEDDFFDGDEIFKKKKNKLSNLLVASSHDDTLIIKTPQNKGKKIPDTIITPRTELMGRLAAVTPSTEPFTPSTSFPASISKPAHRKAALEVMFHQQHHNMRKPRGIRKALHDSMISTSSALDKKKNLPLLELPDFPEAPDTNGNDSSFDDYFNVSNDGMHTE